MNQKLLSPTDPERAAILEIINTYFFALDSREFELFKKVFSNNATMIVSMPDLDPIVFEGYDSIFDGMKGVAAYKISRHTPSNLQIEINGDKATTTIHALDSLFCDERSPMGLQLIEHGLLYKDMFKKTDDGWRIAKRELTCLWRRTTGKDQLKDCFPD